MLLAHHGDFRDTGDRRDDLLHLTGGDVLATDFQEVGVALDVGHVAAGRHLDHVPGLEPAVLEALLVRLGVVEVLEEELNAAGPAEPQLAGAPLLAELAGLAVDDGHLVAGGHPAHGHERQDARSALPVMAWVTVSVMPYAA